MTTITTAGGNLFAIAARQLGDATQWLEIAQLNAPAWPTWPPDPWNLVTASNGPVTLVIPAPDPSLAGQGIPQQ